MNRLRRIPVEPADRVQGRRRIRPGPDLRFVGDGSDRSAGESGISAGHLVLYPSLTVDYRHESNVLFASGIGSGNEIIAADVRVIQPRIMAELRSGRIGYAGAIRRPIGTTRPVRWPRPSVSAIFSIWRGSSRWKQSGHRLRDHFVRGTTELREVDPGARLLRPGPSRCTSPNWTSIWLLVRDRGSRSSSLYIHPIRPICSRLFLSTTGAGGWRGGTTTGSVRSTLFTATMPWMTRDSTGTIHLRRNHPTARTAGLA